MNWKKWMRQLHRWLSIIFTLTVIANFVNLALPEPKEWIGFMALPPLVFLLFTGLYLFVLPYTAKGSTAVGHKEG